jgi:hypothetical protein
VLARFSCRTCLALGSWVFGIAALWLQGCSVFPDEVIQPSAGSTAGAAGAGGSPNANPTTQGGAGDQSEANGGDGGAAPEGQAGAQPAGGDGGAPISGGGGADTGDAGDAGASAQGGAGPGPGCAGTLIERVARFSDDTWIDSSKASTNHGDEALLQVDKATEQRALLSLTLDAAPTGAVLATASVTLTLVTNADTTGSTRTLELHVLTRSFEEPRASWTNWGKGGSRQWQAPGGDFGPAIAQAAVPASSPGKVTFDVSAAVAEIFVAQAVPLSLIVVEVGSTVSAPSSLAFGSSEGDASAAPQLVIQYCPP